jgi:hypothetical protein
MGLGCSEEGVGARSRLDDENGRAKDDYTYTGQRRNRTQSMNINLRDIISQESGRSDRLGVFAYHEDAWFPPVYEELPGFPGSTTLPRDSKRRQQPRWELVTTNTTGARINVLSATSHRVALGTP